MTAIRVAMVPLTIAEIQLLRHHLAKCDDAQCDVLKAKLDGALDEVTSSQQIRGDGS